MTFFTGFLGATLVGVIAGLFAESWRAIEAAQKRMYSPPNPALRSTAQTNIKGIGVNPEESPIQVLSNGCSTIILRLLLQLVILTIIAIFVWLMPGGDIVQQEVPEEFFVGIVFAAILGLLGSSIIRNWWIITNLYEKMVNPPNPSLSWETDPNDHHVAAKPGQSACDVVAGGCIEIIGRVLWQILLIGLLGLTLLGMYRYLAG
jgi:hypothetical protein